MTRLSVNGHHYHVKVSGSGVPIVLLHGFTGDTSTWDRLRLALESTYQVIVIDILGHGQSDKPPTINPYYMENVAHDIAQLIEQLTVQQGHLLGYSMGGRLALYLAIHYPDHFHSLILESASPGLAVEQEREARRNSDNALADQIEANGIQWFVNYWEQLSLWDSQKSLPQTILDAQHYQRLQNEPHGIANSLRGMGTGIQPNLWDMLSKLTVPTHLIVGEVDKKFCYVNQDMAQKLPDVTMKTIRGAGHTIHLEAPTEFIEEVTFHLSHAT